MRDISLPTEAVGEAYYVLICILVNLRVHNSLRWWRWSNSYVYLLLNELNWKNNIYSGASTTFILVLFQNAKSRNKMITPTTWIISIIFGLLGTSIYIKCKWFSSWKQNATGFISTLDWNELMQILFRNVPNAILRPRSIDYGNSIRSTYIDARYINKD